MATQQRDRWHRLARQDGYSLLELLVAAGLIIGALAVMGSALTVIARTQPRVADRAAQIQDGRAMVEQLTRELREGSNVQSPTAASVTFQTFVRKQQCGGSAASEPSAPAIQCQVSYVCSADACTRREGTASPVEIVDGLRSPAIFSYSGGTPPTYVTVTLEYPAQDGSESITLSDGAALRNSSS